MDQRYDPHGTLIYFGIFFMKVKHLIEKLQRENEEEEVVFIFNDERSEYHVIEHSPFLHAGPSTFIDKQGEAFKSSVVIIPIKKS